MYAPRLQLRRKRLRQPEEQSPLELPTQAGKPPPSIVYREADSATSSTWTPLPVAVIANFTARVREFIDAGANTGQLDRRHLELEAEG